MDVSIIIPFYRRNDLLRNLISSLSIAIENSNQLKFEIIIVNDSPEIKVDSDFIDLPFNNVEVIIVDNVQNIGVAASRNHGLEIAKGQYMHLIDQDDMVSIDFYQELNLDENLYDFYLSNTKFEYENNYKKSHKLYYIEPKWTLSNYIAKNFIRSPGQVVFRKTLLQFGSIRFPVSAHKGADDRFFWIEIMSSSSFKYKYIASANYIALIHKHNVSHDLDNLYLSCIENWRDILDRVEFVKEDRELILSDICLHWYFLSDSKYKLFKLATIRGWLNYYFNLNKIIAFIIKSSV